MWGWSYEARQWTSVTEQQMIQEGRDLLSQENALLLISSLLSILVVKLCSTWILAVKGGECFHQTCTKNINQYQNAGWLHHCLRKDVWQIPCAATPLKSWTILFLIHQLFCCSEYNPCATMRWKDHQWLKGILGHQRSRRACHGARICNSCLMTPFCKRCEHRPYVESLTVWGCVNTASAWPREHIRPKPFLSPLCVGFEWGHWGRCQSRAIPSLHGKQATDKGQRHKTTWGNLTWISLATLD